MSAREITGHMQPLGLNLHLPIAYCASRAFIRLSPFGGLYGTLSSGESLPLENRGLLMLTKPRLIHAMIVSLFLIAGPAVADTLPLPSNLIDLASEQGEHLLLDAEARTAYWPLSVQFVTQKNQAYCGVASLVMVMN